MNEQKPEIIYPCSWAYRIIGQSAELITEAVSEIMGNREYTFVESNKSKGGKYLSFNLETVVQDEEYRVSLFHQLKSNPNIIMVL